MITLKNTREEFYDVLWKTPGRNFMITFKNTREEKEKKAHDMETLPLKSTINYE